MAKNKKTALITGIAGQDGSYLAEFLLEKDYEVHGTVVSLKKIERMEHIKSDLLLHECDATDNAAVEKLVKDVLPDEIYHLAAMANASISPDTESEILNSNLAGIHNILIAAKEHSPKSKIFFASSNLMFGVPVSFPQNENTPINPTTPYGIAKATGYFLVKMHRESYGMFACSGILFNHESPRRNPEAAMKKIVYAASRIKQGLETELKLANLNAKKEYGFAGDYVETMWLMLQRDNPEDFVIGTGESHSVRELVQKIFIFFNLDWEKYVSEDPVLKRPLDPNIKILADISKAKKILGWEPKTSFDSLVKMMAEADSGDSKNGK